MGRRLCYTPGARCVGPSHCGGAVRQVSMGVHALMILPPMFVGEEVELIESLDRYPDLPLGTRGFVTKSAQNGIVTVHIRGWKIVAAVGAFRVVDEDEDEDAES